jgi:hypothetical protein
MGDKPAEDKAKPEEMFAWAEPPAAPKRAGGGGRTVSPSWLAIANLLKEHVDTWAKISEHDSLSKANNHAMRIRTGKAKAFNPPRYFEAVARQLDTEEGQPELFAVFARYHGEPPAAPVAPVAQQETVNA